MRQLGLLLAFFVLLVAAAPQSDEAYKPSTEEIAAIREKMLALGAHLALLRDGGTPDALRTEVEIYHKAAGWLLRYPEEVYSQDYVQYALDGLDAGMSRARLLAEGQHPWTTQKGRVLRAYRSRVDGSVQPYGLLIPDSYDGESAVRLDVVLHGRNHRLTEVRFIANHSTGEPLPENQDFIQLNIFGRTNNAYRWSGESDVFEALEAVERDYQIDPDRIVLRGFSMGGAGAWHIGLHHPDRWAAVEAGAGFTETVRYARQPHLPPHQRRALRIYDAVDYSLNAVNVPVIGYGGENDAQLQAAVNIREALAREGFRFQPDGLNWTTTDLRAIFPVGPNIGHRFHPESKALSNRFIDAVVAPGRRVPDHIRFVTYTTRYPRAFWLTVDGLERHYDRAEVEAKRTLEHGRARQVSVNTRNVSRLKLSDLGDGATVTIDDQTVSARQGLGESVFIKTRGRWRAAKTSDANGASLRKKPGLQGPIDDAFRDAFLCVWPTGESNRPRAHQRALGIAKLFAKEYPRWLRADVPFKDDADVTEEDIARHHLVLFGDPGSNRLLSRIAERLPIRWSAEEIEVGDRSFDAANHLLAMIYPNPLNPERYVVINSGHTFHEAQFRGTNAYLFPRLGDYAVLRLGGDQTQVVHAGFFDERWQAPPIGARPGDPLARLGVSQEVLPQTARDSQIRYVGLTKYLNGAKAVVSHTADDSSSKIPNALAALDRHDIKATFFISTARGDLETLWPVLARAVRNGHEVGSHARTHPCQFPPDRQFCTLAYTDSELNGSRDDILAQVDQPHVWSFAYPCGLCSEYDFVHRKLRKAGYLFARIYPDEENGGHLVPDMNTWDEDRYRATYTQSVQKEGGIAPRGRTDVAAINAKFDEVHRQGGIYNFLTHPNWLDYHEGNFYEQHLAYIARRDDIWYVPNGPLYAYESVVEHTQVHALGEGRFAVVHDLSPTVYPNSVTLEFEMGQGKIWTVRSGRTIRRRDPGPTYGWEGEYYRRDGDRLLLTVKPNSVVEIQASDR